MSEVNLNENSMRSQSHSFLHVLSMISHGCWHHCYFMTCYAEMDNLIGSLKDAGLCKDVHYKELYIPQAELEGEQIVGCCMLRKDTMLFTGCFPVLCKKAACSLLLLCCGCKTCGCQL